MSEVSVKICGVKTAAMAEAAVNQGADFIGLVLAPSSRRVSLDQAQALTRQLPHIRFIAVVRDMAAEDLEQLLAATGVWGVQYHGASTFDWIGMVHHAGRQAIATQVDERADIVLLDGPEPGQGRTWAWQRPWISQPLWLAGGLSPDNVRQVVETLKPSGVDVSSGVETEGEKDLVKITAFIKEAKQWQS